MTERAPLAPGYHAVRRGQIPTVVTYLEMTARPALPNIERPRGVAIDKVEAPSLEWYRELFRAVGGNYLWTSRLRMADEELRAILDHPQVELFELTAANGGRGILELDFRVAGQCEIAFFGVTAELFGAGAARYFMGIAIARAFERPIARLWLHSCTLDHPGALRFYRRQGFTPCGFEVEIIDDPRLQGLLPRDAAPHVPLIE